MGDLKSSEIGKYPDSSIRFIDESGYPYGIKHANNKPRVSSMPYLYDIAEGNVPNHKIWSKIGHNPVVTTPSEIVSPQGGVYVFPTAEQHMHVKSDSTADSNVLETGLRTLTIYYLDDDYIERSTVVALNGTTSVGTDVSDIFRIQNVRAETVGASAYAAVGNISIMNHAETITYGYIAATNNRQRQMVWTVPAGQTLYVTNFNRSAVATVANKYCLITLKANYDEKDNHLLTEGLFFMTYAEVALGDNVSNVIYEIPLKFYEKTDIIVTAISTGTSLVQCALRGWLET